MWIGEYTDSPNVVPRPGRSGAACGSEIALGAYADGVAAVNAPVYAGGPLHAASSTRQSLFGIA